jgi:hypothetical protein
MVRPQVKGNVFKNKRVLMEAIHLQKAERARAKAISEQFEARRAKGKVTRARKLERRNERLAGVTAQPHMRRRGDMSYTGGNAWNRCTEQVVPRHAFDIAVR